MAPTLAPVEISAPTSSPTTIVTDPPTVSATDPPTSSDTTVAPTVAPPSSSPISITPAPSTRDPTLSPTPAETVPSSTFDKDKQLSDDRTPPQDPELGGCLYLNENSQMVDFIQEGDAFDPAIVGGPCSPSKDWPVICNPAIPNGGMEYPYCVFETMSMSDTVAEVSSAKSLTGASTTSNTVCAHSDERVNVTLPNGSSEECSCLYFNPLLGPSSSCPMISVQFPAGNGGGSNTKQPTISPSLGDGIDDGPSSNNDGVTSSSATSTATAELAPRWIQGLLLLGGALVMG
ncbi:MAG: hypothetical protein SGILL_003923 [Bacillariaceae sp.]